MSAKPASTPVSASGRVAAATERLSRHLALAYTALIIYASLHPFSGWRDSALSPFAFLEAGWPRYWTGFDLVAILDDQAVQSAMVEGHFVQRMPGRDDG